MAKLPSEKTMVDGLNFPFQSTVAVRVGKPVVARGVQLLLALVPVALRVPPATPELPVQVSLAVKVKFADGAVPVNDRGGETTSLPLLMVHVAVPEAFVLAVLAT
jgi:hypothetical protein